MQLAVTRESVDGSDARRIRWRDDRRSGLSGRTKWIAGPSTPLRGWVFEMLLPQQMPAFHIDRVQVVGYAGFYRDLFGTAARVDPFNNQRREERVHLYGL